MISKKLKELTEMAKKHNWNKDFIRKEKAKLWANVIIDVDIQDYIDRKISKEELRNILIDLLLNSENYIK